jgi:manganese/iron transport system substrate-binding protein
MLRKKTLISSIIALGIGFASYSLIDNRKTTLAQDKPNIVASYSVLCDLFKTIAEDTINLTCLIEGNEEPHTYRPTPSDRKAMEEAQIMFYGGYNLEPQIVKLIEATKTDVPKVPVNEAAVPQPILAEHHHEHGEEEEGEHHEEHHHQEEGKAAKEKKEPDPHVWHDVRNTIAMVELIQATLIQLNPVAADVYLKNASALNDKLYKLDSWIREQIATIPEGKRILVTTHDSLNYYVKAYELEGYKAIQGLSPDDTPTASRVRELVTEIKAAQVPTIFAEITSSDRVLNTIARETNVKISDQQLFTDGLGETGTAEESYVGMMESNTCAIVNGLGGQCNPFEGN